MNRAENPASIPIDLILEILSRLPSKSTGWGPRAERAGVGGPLAVGGSGRYKWYQSQVSYLSSDLRGVLRPVGGATRTLRSLRGAHPERTPELSVLELE
ncbi:hypothetical protein YC2023_064352 [Brassica napus]